MPCYVISGVIYRGIDKDHVTVAMVPRVSRMGELELCSRCLDSNAPAACPLGRSGRWGVGNIECRGGCDARQRLYPLGGRVLDVNGMPAFFATVFVQSETAIYSGAVSFEQGLQYRIVLPDGTYSVSVMMSVFDPTGMTPGPQLTNITFDLLETVVVSGDTVRDFVTPALPPLLTVTG